MSENLKPWSDSGNAGLKPGNNRDGSTSPAVLAQRAIELAETYDTPLEPKVFEVWYACAAGNPEKLRRDLEARLRKSGSVTRYDIEQLHQEHLGLTEQQRRQQELAHSYFDREMQKAIDLVQNHIGTNERYSGSIERTAQTMRSTVDPEKLRDALGMMLMEMSRMRAESVKLNHNLQQTRVQVRRLSASLEKARENEARDPLTGIANRRYFDRMLPHCIAEARKNSNALSLVMADIDHFKSINDEFGHQVGDDVLRYFAALLQKNIKGRDIAARYGGEEFVLILPQTGIREASTLIGQIMAELTRANLVVTKDKNRLGKVTCSFGIAEMRKGEMPDALVGRADMKLYDAKQAGRNRFVCDAA